MQNSFYIKKTDILSSMQKFNLSIQKVQYVGKGQYSKVYLLNDDLIFKFPLSEEAIRVISRERKIFDIIKDRLTVQIPKILYYGNCKGKPFVCTNRIFGKCLNKKFIKTLTIENKKKLAKQLALFFTEIHQIKVDKKIEKILEKIDFKTATKNYFKKEYLSKIKNYLTPAENIFILEGFNRYLGNDKNFKYSPVVVHGDLHLENMFFDLSKKRLSGIIDFGDVNIADAVYDFRYLDLYFGRQFTLEVLKNYKGSISGDIFAKLEIFNLCNFIFDALFALKQKNEKDKNTAIKNLKRTIKQYKEYRSQI